MRTVRQYFYPRSPCGERQFKMPVPAWIYSFLSTLSLRRATDGSICLDSKELFLSTLSLRRATGHAVNLHPEAGNFYPRSPCGERPQKKKHNPANQTFLSTLSLRRATKYHRILLRHSAFLSTLSLRRATSNLYRGRNNRIFLSTLSLRRATLKSYLLQSSQLISIHALLAESDACTLSAL